MQAYEHHNRNTGERRMYTRVGIQETTGDTDILCNTTIGIQEKAGNTGICTPQLEYRR